MMEERVSALEKELDIVNRKLLQLAWKIDDIEKMKPDEPSGDIERISESVDVDVYDLRGKLVVVESELSELRTRIGVINELISSYEAPVGHLPDSNIISNSLWKRMWAVFGHGLLGNVILTLWIVAIVMILFRGL
jgi:hypothetical protein